MKRDSGRWFWAESNLIGRELRHVRDECRHFVVRRENLGLGLHLCLHLRRGNHRRRLEKIQII